MALVVCNNGEIKILAAALSNTDMHLHLFSNDYTPVATTTTANLTEATFTDYSSKALAKATWGTPTTDGNGKAASTYGATQTWTAGSSQTVYGYYITEDGGNTLLWAERFAVARALASSDQLSITPAITLASEN